MAMSSLMIVPLASFLFFHRVAASCEGNSCEAQVDDDLPSLLEMSLLQTDRRTTSGRQAGMEGDSMAPWVAPEDSAVASQPVAASLASPDSAFDCAKYPKMCEAPFNCHKNEAALSWASTWIHGIAEHGPYAQGWCDSLEYQDYAHECLATKDLVKAGHLQYKDTKAGKFGPNTFELDGSYCFIEGHCLNTAVTSSTTLEEASQMCDERFGHERWATFGSFRSSDVTPPPPLDSSNGFDGQHNTAPYLVAACAMGNYHCDVIQCKETYCKDEYFVKKYGHFLQDLGWTNFTASWMHA